MKMLGEKSKEGKRKGGLYNCRQFFGFSSFGLYDFGLLFFGHFVFQSFGLCSFDYLAIVLGPLSFLVLTPKYLKYKNKYKLIEQV